VQRLPRAEPISRAYQAVICWGGLRGTSALALVLSLPPFEQYEVFVALVIGEELFVLIVKGLSTEPLVRWLSLDCPLLADRLAVVCYFGKPTVSLTSRRSENSPLSLSTPSLVQSR